MNKKFNFLFVLLSLGVSFSCSNKSKPKRVYMPDMYYSQSYEPYLDPQMPYSESENQVDLFKKGKTTSLAPVKGTVARNSKGILPYEFANTNEGYDLSKKVISSPLNSTSSEKDLKRGKELYQIYCAICHGPSGAGDGVLAENGKILGVPNYKDREITIGSIYHVIMYGRNSMGSYASQLNEADRWKVAKYVMNLKNQK